MSPTSPLDDREGLASLVRLQILVLTLGQPKHLSWWKSEFLSPTGLRYLQRLYPRDYFWAAVRSSALAAKDVHDNAIGVKDTFHLFRAPSSVANKMRSLPETMLISIEQELSPILEDQSQLLAKLAMLAGDTHSATQVGPVRIGTDKVFATAETIAHLAFLYHSAFQRGTKTYPYFEQAAPRR